jgi:hypothetical protein
MLSPFPRADHGSITASRSKCQPRGHGSGQPAYAFDCICAAYRMRRSSDEDLQQLIRPTQLPALGGHGPAA